MINFEFNEKRATQAAAFFIEKNGCTMNHMKLIKLLYLADRVSIKKWYEPITGDKYFSLPHGPIVSNILDKINHTQDIENQSYWYNYIEKSGSHEVSLLSKIEYDELSKRELKLLNDLDEYFKNYTQWEMVKFCHENVPEWQDPKDSRLDINIEQIIEATADNEEEKNQILAGVTLKSFISRESIAI